ncbi:MAG: spore germination protein [Patescibacteria group bacterium]
MAFGAQTLVSSATRYHRIPPVRIQDDDAAADLPERNDSLDKLATLLPQTGFQKYTDLETAASDLLLGRTLVFLDNETEAISFKTQGWARHELKEPTLEPAIRGPREGFTETLSENIGMIRRWIEDRRLRADQLKVGRRTKTKIAVMYLSDVAQPRLVAEVKRRLSAIDIDGIIDSGYLEQLIADRRASIFQLSQATERTDKVTASILEGRVAILVDKSPFVILVPVTVNELYQSAEDFYLNFWLASFTRLLRLLGNVLAVGLPGLYVAFASVNPDLLPPQFALIIASSRAHAPLPLVAEVFILEVALGVFYEAALRLPGALSQTVGIVSGIILGLVGIFSGIVSPATVIVVAVTAVASYTGPNYAVGLTTDCYWAMVISTTPDHCRNRSGIAK